MEMQATIAAFTFLRWTRICYPLSVATRPEGKELHDVDFDGSYSHYYRKT
jgi:hypothetical protein